MKERTITQNVYETGDILDITKVIIDLKNRRNISDAQKGIVIAVNELTKDPDVRYMQGEKSTCIELYKMQSMCTYIDGEKEKDAKHN